MITLKRLDTVYLPNGKSDISLMFDDDGQTVAISIPSDDERNAELMNYIEELTLEGADIREYADELYEMASNVSSVRRVMTLVDELGEDHGFELNLDAGSIVYRGETVDETIARQVIRLGSSGVNAQEEHARALLRFVQRLYRNPSRFVREQFYRWLNYVQMFESGFTITSDGRLMGYKGLKWGNDSETGEQIPVSIHTGHAFSDGVEHFGHIPNPVGAKVSMPRSEVTDDPNIGCSAGLHVGTYGYAKGFGHGLLMRVIFDPRDIVSVPTECDSQKIRVSLYENLEMSEFEYTEPVYFLSDDDYDYEQEEGWSEDY